MTSIEQEIIERVGKLGQNQQQRVLEFVRSLSRPKGEPGRLLVQHARAIQFPPEDLEEISQAIEEEFESVEGEDEDGPNFPAGH